MRIIGIPARDRETLLLTLLITTDVIFMVLHVLHRYSGFFIDPQFSLTKDRGFAETFQYLKEGWIALVLLALTLRTPNLLYPGWALLFGYLLLDDLFALHERLGFRISRHLGFPEMLGLRPEDFGEVTVSASAAVFLFALIGVGHYRADPAARSISRSLFALLAGLVFFGVVVDLIHVMLAYPVWLDLVEDGGEMVMMSAIVWFVLRTYPESPTPC